MASGAAPPKRRIVPQAVVEEVDDTSVSTDTYTLSLPPVTKAEIEPHKQPGHWLWVDLTETYLVDYKKVSSLAMCSSAAHLANST
jgi:hypothetical protein